MSSERVSIPLLKRLIPEGIRQGTVFVVEFDPQSQWLAVATTIAARYLQEMGRVGFVTFTRPPEDVMRDLAALGVDIPAVQKENRLVVDDWYSATLTGGRLKAAGQTGVSEPIPGGRRMLSLKVSDLSVEWLKGQKEGWQSDDLVETWPPGAIVVGDSGSELLRFNEENSVVEYFVTRVSPNERRAGRIFLVGFARGIHTETFYKRMESAAGGVIDIRVEEREGEINNLIRVTSLKGQPHDTHWHKIEVKPNGEASLTA